MRKVCEFGTAAVSGAALAVMPTSEVDVRLGRPAPPERLSSQERELWEKLTHSLCRRRGAAGKLRVDHGLRAADRGGAAQD